MASVQISYGFRYETVSWYNGNGTLFSYVPKGGLIGSRLRKAIEIENNAIYLALFGGTKREVMKASKAVNRFIIRSKDVQVQEFLKFLRKEMISNERW